MLLRQKIFAIIVVILMFIVIIYLVKERKLREEYSWLWLITGTILFILIFYYDILLFITKVIGAVVPTSTLFLFGIVFLIFLSLHFAIKISYLYNQVKNLAQKISLLERTIAENEGKELDRQ